jgi:hypothetical protein
MLPQDHRHHAKVFEGLWHVFGLFFLAALAIFIAFRFEFEETALAAAGQTFATCAASYFLLRSQKTQKIGIVLSAMFQYGLIFASIGMLTLCLATLNYPWFDGPLLALDRALGYDWHAYAHAVHGSAALTILYRIGYTSIIWQPLAICAILALSGHADRLAIFLLSTFLTLLTMAAIFTFCPVTTAWIYTNAISVAEMKELYLPAPGEGWPLELAELRAGRGRLVSWGIDPGVIGFPSFHCAAGLLNCWALWKLQMMRYAALALNAFMLAATPLLGGHYLADIGAGAVVACACIYLAIRLCPSLAKQPKYSLARSFLIPRGLPVRR